MRGHAAAVGEKGGAGAHFGVLQLSFTYNFYRFFVIVNQTNLVIKILIVTKTVLFTRYRKNFYEATKFYIHHLRSAAR